MHRFSRIGTTLALLLLSVVAAPAALGQDTAAPPPDGHPLVGAWLVDTDTTDPSDPPARVVLTSDGSAVQVDVNGSALGVWAPTGVQSGALTLTSVVAEGEGAVSTATIRATLEVTEDGQGWTVEFTVEFVGADGTSSGQMGPVSAAATRITVEPMAPDASLAG